MNPLLTSGLDAHRGFTALSVNVNLVAQIRNRRPLPFPSVPRLSEIALQAGAHGITIHPRLELGSNEAIKQAILAGLGISALSRHALTLNQPGQFAELDVVGFPILRHWYAVYPAGRQLSVVARAFLDYLLGLADAAPAVPRSK